MAPGTARGQGRIVREGGPDLLAVGTDPVQLLAGGSLWWRVAPRTRVGGLLAGGARGGKGVVRAEAVGHFLLNPAARRGVSFYGGGGLAMTGPTDREGLMVVVLGLEQRAGARSGWIMEVGVGGGVRVGVGWRWRRGGVA